FRRRWLAPAPSAFPGIVNPPSREHLAVGGTDRADPRRDPDRDALRAGAEFPELVRGQAGTAWPTAPWNILGFPSPQTCGPSGYRDRMAAMANVPEDNETTRLIAQAVRGDRRALGELLGRHRERLHRMVALRIDRRLQGRVDPSDILQ